MKDTPVASCPRTALHFPWPRHDRTAFMQLDSSRCKGCGRCIGACPNRLLSMVSLLGHRHAHVDAAARCRGCLSCVGICVPHALRPRSAPSAVYNNHSDEGAEE